MKSCFVRSVDREGVEPLEMPGRFRHDVTYFCTPAGEPGAPAMLGPHEYFIRREDALRIFEDGVIRIVSPLDSSSTAEIEITEDHEVFLEWLQQHDVQHVRIE